MEVSEQEHAANYRSPAFQGGTHAVVTAIDDAGGWDTQLIRGACGKSTPPITPRRRKHRLPLQWPHSTYTSRATCTGNSLRVPKSRVPKSRATVEAAENQPASLFVWRRQNVNGFVGHLPIVKIFKGILGRSAFMVEVDGRGVGELYPGQNLGLELDAGDHKVLVHNSKTYSEGLYVNIQNGEKLSCWCQAKGAKIVISEG